MHILPTFDSVTIFVDYVGHIIYVVLHIRIWECLLHATKYPPPGKICRHVPLKPASVTSTVPSLSAGSSERIATCIRMLMVSDGFGYNVYFQPLYTWG